jgi:hypothetical protein
MGGMSGSKIAAVGYSENLESLLQPAAASQRKITASLRNRRQKIEIV